MPPTLQSFEPSATAEESGSAGPLLASLQWARHETRRAMDERNLGRVVDALATEAVRRGFQVIYGGSDFGHQLAGAMAYSAPQLRIWAPGSAERVLLVDAVVVSPAGLESAAETLRALGATDVGALVLHLPHGYGATIRPGSALTRFFALESGQPLAA